MTTKKRTPLAVLPLLVGFLALVPLGRAAADTFEPNDSVAQAAGPLSSGVQIESFISSISDLDYYYFDANLGSFSISLTSIPFGTDYDLYIVDESNTAMLSSENSDNSPEEIQANVTSPGRFWIAVVPFDGFSASDSYFLTATFNPLVTNTAPTITLNSPNGGETITGGTVFNVTWSASDTEDGTSLTIDVAYSSNGGASFTSLATGIANTGSYAWSVPTQGTTTGRIRVTAHDSGGLTDDATSASNFTIATITPQLVLSIPGSFTQTPGSTFDVPVSFSNNLPVAGLQFALKFTSGTLMPVSVTGGARMAALTLTSNTSLGDEVRVVFHHPSGGTLAAGDGTACTIRFQVAAGPPGNTSLAFGDVVAADASGSAMTVNTQNGTVTAVRDVRLAATAMEDGVHLAWSAETDAGHIGFRVLRGAESPVAVHDGLLPADRRDFVDRTAPAGRLVYWLEAIDRSGLEQRFGPLEVTGIAPAFRVGAPWPNPFAGAVRLDVAATSPIRAEVFDASGRLVRRFVDLPAGAGTLSWDGRRDDGALAPAGIYFIRVRGGDATEVRRIVRSVN